MKYAMNPLARRLSRKIMTCMCPLHPIAAEAGQASPVVPLQARSKYSRWGLCPSRTVLALLTCRLPTVVVLSLSAALLLIKVDVPGKL